LDRFSIDQLIIAGWRLYYTTVHSLLGEVLVVMTHTFPNNIFSIIQVLRKIEQLKMMRVAPEASRQKIDQLLQQEDLTSGSVIDEASHFILRLSYCQNEELRKWFLTQESALFQHRLKSLTEEQLAFAVKDHCQLKPMTDHDKNAMADQLQVFTVNPAEFAVTQFYAVPFEQALDLVAKRQCYLRAGLAYVPQNLVLSIILHKFRTHLSRCLAIMGNSSHANLKLGQDDPEAMRIHPLLRNMSRVLVNSEPDAGDNSLQGSQTLNAANVLHYKENMPLCMRQLQTGMQQDKKLKHWGRLQYGLFLKGAGLSMEDALAFFQKHFTTVTGEQFQKQYSYNIRHMYGKEGKRASYTPYPCSKIILGNAPAAGDHHGCPYKHYDNDHLESLLRQLKIGSSQDRASIMALKKSNQYQLACQKHFEVMHPNAGTTDGVSLDNVGNHPNAWFRASVAYKEAKSGATAAGAEVSP